MLLLEQHPEGCQRAGRAAGNYNRAAPPLGRPQTTPHSLGKWWESPEGRIFAAVLFFTSLDLLHRADQKPGGPPGASPQQSPITWLGQEVNLSTHPSIHP